MTWNMAEARNRLSEVVNLALTEGPQTITRQHDAVVVISAETYAELTAPRPGFKNFLMSGPPLDELELERAKSPTRALSHQIPIVIHL